MSKVIAPLIAIALALAAPADAEAKNCLKSKSAPSGYEAKLTKLYIDGYKGRKIPACEWAAFPAEAVLIRLEEGEARTKDCEPTKDEYGIENGCAVSHPEPSECDRYGYVKTWAMDWYDGSYCTLWPKYIWIGGKEATLGTFRCYYLGTEEVLIESEYVHVTCVRKRVRINFEVKL
jgi:hypothetical protein